jgi:hypothetical protein
LAGSHTIGVVELFLRVLLFGVLGIVAITLVTLLALWRTLRRRLRVDPKVGSAAPTHWHLSQHKAARAHRRLRMASQAALAVGNTAGGRTAGTSSRQPKKRRDNIDATEFPALAQSIVEHAKAVELDLVHASRLPRAHRNQALQGPLAEVARVEATVAELAATSTAWRGAIDLSHDDSLDEIHDRLTNLRHASEGVKRADDTRTYDLPMDKPTANPTARLQDQPVEVVVETE